MATTGLIAVAALAGCGASEPDLADRKVDPALEAAQAEREKAIKSGDPSVFKKATEVPPP